MLCEIHRRKTAQPQVAFNHHHHNFNGGGQGFFPYPSRPSISPPDSDDQQPNNNWCDSPPPISSPTGGLSAVTNGGYNNNSSSSNNMTSLTALSEDNERLRRNNNMLMSELAHMRKLYNDIIYFVQNHVKPVAPSNSYHSSSFLSNPSSATAVNGGGGGGSSMLHRPLNQLVGYQQMAPQNPKQGSFLGSFINNSSSSSPSKNVSQRNMAILEEPTKLFGVPLSSKKRLHPEYNNSSIETNKTRFVLEKDDLGLNLMPPSPC